MSKIPLPPRPIKLANQRPVRLFEDDDEAIRNLHTQIDQQYDVNIVDLIRLCVRAGRPLVEKRFKKAS